MDKNTVLGFLLIGALLFGFAWFNKPSEQEIKKQQQYNDSIAAVTAITKQQTSEQVKKETIVADSLLTDSAKTKIAEDKFGSFAPASLGAEKIYTLENNLIKMTISSKGGQIVSVQLKKFKTNAGKDLILFNSKKDSTSFGFNLITENNRLVNTKDLFFEGVNLEDKSTVNTGEKSYTFRLKTNTQGYLDYVYTLKADDYMIGFKVKANNLSSVMPMSTNSLELQWNSKIKQQEKSKSFENRYTMLQYKFLGDDIEKMNQAKSEEVSAPTKIKWVAFKDQFFSSILIADDAFSNAKLNSIMDKNDSSAFLKAYKADMSVPFDVTGKKETGFKFYFGPNKFSLLIAYDKDSKSGEELKLQKLVPLGWGIFGWINQFVVIPIFNFFSSFIASFGIIILLLTLVIKLVLFPLTYKSYISMAKMRVLKPQIDEINSRIPATKAQERQKATMELYKKVGVNPLGGCLPMLLQMPILFAMFSFFPAAIELRQQSFLWAADLSSYDPIVSWSTNIPFISNYFGNHISLFCLLMTITNIVYTYINMQNQVEGSQQIPGMKYIMYIMPVLFLFMFNSYASGLSYYYFIATLITIIQTIVIRNFVNEEKLLQKLHENAKNPKKQKKSGFMSKLEEAQRKQIEMQKQRNKH